MLLLFALRNIIIRTGFADLRPACVLPTCVLPTLCGREQQGGQRTCWRFWRRPARSSAWKASRRAPAASPDLDAIAAASRRYLVTSGPHF